MKHLSATSEQLRALLVALLAVTLRELIPPLQEVELEAILVPLVGYMIGKGIANHNASAGRDLSWNRPGLGFEPGHLEESPLSSEDDDELV